jgi:hypothetical protein
MRRVLAIVAVAASVIMTWLPQNAAASGSPGGDRLAFTRYDDRREEAAIFTVHLDGTGLRKLTPWKVRETAV